MGSALLEVSNLQSGYDGGRVLNGMALSLQPAEVIAIIGRNGVGKTTFMRTLMGLLPTDGGSITLNGTDISRFSPDQRARAGLGYVPQGREIFPGLTVEENMKVGLQVLKAGKASDMDAALDFFPILRTRLRQKAGTMSGGEQQQLAIARVLVGKPRVLLLDEPSEGIQPSIVQAISERLVDIARTLGIGVLLVEQNMHMVETAASRCAVVDKGRVVSLLSTDDLHDEALMRRHLAV